MTTTLKNCQLTNGDIIDIVIENEIIKSVGAVKKNNNEIDIDGKLVIPGIIDAHVHFREPGGEPKEDWSTGSRAAVSGGVTTVIDMPNNNPPAIDKQSLNIKRERASKSLCHYGFYLGATKDNLEQIKTAENIAGVKIYVGSSTGNLLVDKDKDIEKLFTIPNILWLIHAEDENIITKNSKKFIETSNPAIHSQIRNKQAAIRAVERIINLAKKTGARVHICHVSTKEEIELIKKAKEERLTITCEVSPHHLFLNENAYQKKQNFAKVNPPLRTQEDNTALMEGLTSGVIDLVATDHAPHLIREKQGEYSKAPAGLPEIETSLPLLLNKINNNLTLQRLVEITSQKPAEIFHIKNKGAIKKGYDADLTVIDLKKTQIITKEMLKTKCGWSPYEGWELTGWPVMTFVNGHLVYDNGKINGQFKGKEIQYGKI